MFGIDVTTAVSAAAGTVFGLLATELVSSLVRKQQRHEKSRDDDQDEIVATIDAVRTLADDYWTKSQEELGHTEAVLRGRIVGGIHHINLLISGLFSGDAKRSCDVAAFKFSDAAGGGTFGNPGRSSEPDRLTSIHSAALTLKHLVKSERRKLRYKPLA